MPNADGTGFVDYVLWGADGKPLGVVEAKRTRRSAQAGEQQARLYADCLEGQFGQRPVIFCTNGYEHWVWDDTAYPPRPVQGFYTRDELALLVQRRTTKEPLSELPIDEQIVARHYQQDFYIFDFCGNLEFSNTEPATVGGQVAASLAERLFAARLALLTGRDVDLGDDSADGEHRLRADLAHTLHDIVVGMNVRNFVVRPHRRWVELYSDGTSWHRLSADDALEIAEHLAGLPSAVRDDDEAAKRFDLLVLRLQLCVLSAEPGFERLRDQGRYIASALLEVVNIPAVGAQQQLLDDVAGEEWWTDVTLPMLELLRRRVRSLVHLVPKARRFIVHADFEDQLGAATDVTLAG